jgi:4a-hydroxytetrahydrobiopterin dehydratase
MSDEGWRAFLRADGLQDWVVLHGGPVCVYPTADLAAAMALASAIAAVPGVAGSGVLLTISDRRVSVRLLRDQLAMEPIHVELARAISLAAKAHGAIADRAAVQEVQVAIAAKPESIDVEFWRAVLGYDAEAPDNAVDPLGHGSSVWMQEIDPSKTLRHAMHIDVSVAHEQLEARLAAALAAGGRIVDASHAPAHWTLADRAGNRVCIVGWPDGSNRVIEDFA